jgi:hypothetical protein
MVSPRVHTLCQSSDTVTSELLLNPTEAPGHIIQRLYPESAAQHHPSYKRGGPTPFPDPDPEAFQKALECGKWGTNKPSELFLRVSRVGSVVIDKIDGWIF